MIARTVVGLLIALLIAGIARQQRLLTTGAAALAVLFGSLAMLAGVRWGILLALYFVAASALSSWRRGEKTRRLSDFVEKTTARDARQVLANGSIFIVAALLAAMTRSEAAIAAGLAALAASMADTAATEVGSAIGGEPRLITTGQKVEYGRSGGVTLVGSAAMLFGAFALGGGALILGFGSASGLPAIAGGIAGAVADSLLGALVQERRRCPACGRLTERRLHLGHDKPVATDVAGGVRGFDNDWVNLTSTLIAGIAAAALSRGGI